jgi:hypothetical protein
LTRSCDSASIIRIMWFTFCFVSTNKVFTYLFELWHTCTTNIIGFLKKRMFSYYEGHVDLQQVTRLVLRKWNSRQNYPWKILALNYLSIESNESFIMVLGKKKEEFDKEISGNEVNYFQWSPYRVLSSV